MRFNSPLLRGQCHFARLGYKPCERAGYALVRELVDEEMQTGQAMKKGERKYIRRLIKPDPTSHIAQGPRSKRQKAPLSKSKSVRRRR